MFKPDKHSVNILSAAGFLFFFSSFILGEGILLYQKDLS